MIRFLVKIPKHKQFNYSPVYFNEAKEDLDKRVQAAQGGYDSGVTKIARGSLKESWGRSARIAKSDKTSTIRLMVIIAILSLFVFWVLK